MAKKKKLIQTIVSIGSVLSPKGNDDKGEEGFGRTFGLLAVSAGFTSGAGALAVSKGKGSLAFECHDICV
jgi:hypothetical protein